MKTGRTHTPFIGQSPGTKALENGYTLDMALVMTEFFLMWTLRASRREKAGGVALER